MGKALLLITLAATLAGATLFFSTNRANVEAEASLDGYERTIVSREIAQSGFNMATERLQREFSSWRDGYRNKKFQGGVFDTRVSGPAIGPVEVTTVGRIDTTAFHIKALYARVASQAGAVIADADKATVTYNGASFLISGTDVRPPSLTDNTLTKGSQAAVPAVIAGTADLRSTFTSSLTGGLTSRITGANGDADIVAKSGPSYLDQIYNEAKNSAVATKYEGAQNFSSQTFGTPTTPAVIVVNGNATLTSVTGYGILVVDGNLTLKGNTYWEGVVFAKKDGEMTVVHQDNAEIYGSLILRNKSEGNYAIELPECGSLKIRYVGSNAGLISAFYIEHPQAEMIFPSNKASDQWQTTQRVYNKGQKLNFFIRVFGSAWGIGDYDHYAKGHNDPYTGKPYAQIEQLSTYKWRLNFEDLPGKYVRNGKTEYADWDYDDEVVEIELIPGTGQCGSVRDDIFEIESDGEVKANEDVSVRVDVLGVAIASGNTPLPVTARLGVKSGSSTNWTNPWGSYSSPVSSNLNTGQRYTFTFSEPLQKDQRLRAVGVSWSKKSSSYNGTQNSHYETFISAEAGTGTKQVKVLRNGDPVPNISGFNGQQSAQAYIKDYIGTNGKMKLQDDQVIYLYELGTTSLNTSAADFQDLVLLVTFGAPNSAPVVTNIPGSGSGNSSGPQFTVTEASCHTCSGGKTPVLHLPPGNPGNAQQLCLPTPAVNTHLTHHGDVVCGQGIVNLGSSGAGASITQVSLQAEEGASNGGPFQTYSNDNKAHQNGYIAPHSTANSPNSAPSSGVFSYDFSVTESGNYAVWGRVIAPNGSSDSFWIKMDNGSWINWNNIPQGSSWHWARVHNANSNNQAVTFNLSKGDHTLYVAYREAGTKLDEIFITKNTSLSTPSANWSGSSLNTTGTLVTGTAGSGNGSGSGADWETEMTVQHLTFTISGNAQVHYSAEAVGRLVDLLPSLQPLASVAMINHYSGPGKIDYYRSMEQPSNGSQTGSGGADEEPPGNGNDPGSGQGSGNDQENGNNGSNGNGNSGNNGNGNGNSGNNGNGNSGNNGNGNSGNNGNGNSGNNGNGNSGNNGNGNSGNNGNDNGNSGNNGNGNGNPPPQPQVDCSCEGGKVALLDSNNNKACVSSILADLYRLLLGYKECN